jgi:hypothetical protein
MKSAAGLHYLVLVCAIVLSVLVAVSCADESSEPMATATPLASFTPKRLATATPLASPTAVPPPQGTVMPISEGAAVWDWIAVNSPECEPILRPTYLPLSLSRVSLDVVDQQRGCVLFGVDYSDSGGGARLLIGGGPWFNPPLPGPDAMLEDVEVRGATRVYQLQDRADPLGYAFVTWNEPGRWGNPSSDWYQDFVEYLVSSEGLPKEELLKVANGLERVQQ